jgi:hypothetical protein
MTREELAHVLRAASTIAKDNEIVVLGSQSILGSYDERALPDEATLSIEADIAFIEDPDEAKSDLIDGVIGEGSSFHEMYGYYGQGVSITTAVLPEGWEDRVIPFLRPDGDPSTARCIDAHDLVVAKLVAGREKDLSFASALLRERLVEEAVLHDRVDLIPRPKAIQERVHRFIRRCSSQASSS